MKGSAFIPRIRRVPSERACSRHIDRHARPRSCPCVHVGKHTRVDEHGRSAPNSYASAKPNTRAKLEREKYAEWGDRRTEMWTIIHTWAKRHDAHAVRVPRPAMNTALPKGAVRELDVTTLKSANAMIYIDKRMNPVFRILGTSRDRMKVILFDQRKRSYATKWVPTRRLAADEHSDLHALQEDPQQYAPNLGDLVQWRMDHPLVSAPN